MRTFQRTSQSILEVERDSYVYSVTTASAREDLQYDNYQRLTAADRIIAISSDDSLHVLSPETLQTLPDGIYRKVNNSVTSLSRWAAVGQKATTFLTAGRDGIVRGWDLRMNKPAVELIAPTARDGSTQPLSALETNYESNTVVAGTELEGEPPGEVKIFAWDSRKPGEPKITYKESHTDTITELKFLPFPSNSSTVLLSGSTDGLINVFDLTAPDEDDALVQVINQFSAIHHTGLIGDEIFALGTDEKLSFHVQQNPDMDIKDADPYHLGDLREKLGCEYAIGVRNHKETPLLAVGNHSGEQAVHLLPLSRLSKSQSSIPQWTPDAQNAIKLAGAHSSEVVRDVLVIFESQVIYTCGEDGSINQWKAA